MIDTNELMLGNWVYANNEPSTVYGIFQDAIQANIRNTGHATKAVYQRNLEPIQLNKEVLEKCGFYEIENWFNNKERCFSNDNDDKIIYYKESDTYLLVGMHCYFNYLHELQNIYFLYRKEQLTVDYESKD